MHVCEGGGREKEKRREKEFVTIPFLLHDLNSSAPVSCTWYCKEVSCGMLPGDSHSLRLFIYLTFLSLHSNKNMKPHIHLEYDFVLMVSIGSDSFSFCCIKKKKKHTRNKCRIIIIDENPSGIDQRKWQAYLSHLLTGFWSSSKSDVKLRLSLSKFIMVDLLKQGLVLDGSNNGQNK